MEAAQPPRMTWKEYLAFEETSDVKHEFHDGVLHAMVGVKRAHGLLAARLHAALHTHLLTDQRCDAFFSDFKSTWRR